MVRGVDVAALFREAAANSGPARRVLYEEWAEGYPDVQKIGAMGWVQVDTDYGVGFRH